jgi:hypothetical protein
MTNFSRSFSGRTNVELTIPLHDASDHELNLLEVTGVQKCIDEKWNNAKITYCGTADLIAGSGPQRGYFVNEHSDGDRDWGTFEGMIVSSGGQARMEGTWSFTGGTGKFKDLTGSGRYIGWMTSGQAVDHVWAGTYRIPGL